MLTIQFQVRFAPALANKPRARKPSQSNQHNPFEKPAEGLLIPGMLPFHNVILNKFPIIPDHFILATKQFHEQTHLLEPDDLVATYECVRAYADHGKALFGFFNSGEHSGASQRHRHIQFLPVEAMRNGIASDSQWTVLADCLVQHPPTG